MSATGHYIPPMLIFPRARLTESLKTGAPPETLFSCNGSGWMSMADFNMWFDHFLEHTRPTAASPVLLILDGHVTHTKNIAFLEKAQQNHVTVVSLPPHCSHRMQPLDVSFMAPLKSNFSKAIEAFLKRNPGKVVTVNDVSALFGEAYLKTTTVPVAQSGFKATGIVPFNRFIFTAADFAPSDVTDAPEEVEQTEQPAEDDALALLPHPEQVDQPAEPPILLRADPALEPHIEDDDEGSFHGFDDSDKPNFQDFDAIGIDEPMPCSSQATANMSFAGGAFDVTPEDILPLPKVTVKKSRKKTRREKATELTSSPYRRSLKGFRASKDIKQLKKSERKSRVTPKRPRKPKVGDQSLFQDTLCDNCGMVFSMSEDGAGWSKCGHCGLWFHTCSQNECPLCLI